LGIIIDPDIRKAQTLPSSYYTGSNTLLKIKSSFRENWHFACHHSQLGENRAIELHHMQDLIGEPMIATSSDKIRCLSNVCTHRGMLIVKDKCPNRAIKCGYHGRIFALDGSFRSMPEFEEVDCFPSSNDDLKSFSTFIWRGLVFAGINPSSLEPAIHEMEERIGWMPIEDFEYDESRHRSYDIEANWALYVDNYLEGFHIPFVHKDLNTVLDYDNYQTEIFEGGVLQIGVANDDQPSFLHPEGAPDFGKKIAAYYYWIYPGLMLNFYPWGLSVNLVIPLSVRKTRIIYHGFVWHKSMLELGAGGNLDKVEQEDQEIVELVNRGVSSGTYDRGRYSPTRETGVHHFHRILTENIS